MGSLHHLRRLYTQFCYIYLQVYLGSLILGLWERVSHDEVTTKISYSLFGSRWFGQILEQVGYLLYCALFPLVVVGLVFVAGAIRDRYRPHGERPDTGLAQALYGLLCLAAVPACAALIYWGTDDNTPFFAPLGLVRIGAALVVDIGLGMAIRRLLSRPIEDPRLVA